MSPTIAPSMSRLLSSSVRHIGRVFGAVQPGRQILQERIGADEVIGMHVPTAVPDDRASRRERLQDVDLFVMPAVESQILYLRFARSEPAGF